MKHLITALAVSLAFVTQTHAQTNSDNTCTIWGNLAESSMVARQKGYPLSKLLEKIKGNDLIREVIIGAYEEPRYRTQTYKRIAVQNYRNKWELICYRAK